MTDLPAFRYHPDPIATGVVKPSRARCVVCEQERGLIYSGPVYCEDTIEDCICPWCISAGTAATQFDATFSDDYSLRAAGMPEATIDEITRRTPGYVCWQSQVWLIHCDQVCAFHGDLPAHRLDSLDPEGKAQLSRDHDLTPDNWRALRESYTPGGQPAIYVFRCLRCPRELYHMDYT